eukprot:TRINITY_DN19375_c0_g1_i1.p1 TRINITY_DN19375_c0_g1~~TRINITY_DN19375_c0_g1_i1.p1  ORF type:complete len:401 (+),score=106.27 TRINITY_DN19375_c0_g1_i1:56-1204(+)
MSLAAATWPQLSDDVRLNVVMYVGGRALRDIVALRAVSCNVNRCSREAIRLLLRTGDAAARAEALEAAIKDVQFGCSASMTAVLRRVADESTEMRKAALNALTYLVAPDEKAAPEVLLAAVARVQDADHDVRSAAWQALAQIGGVGHPATRRAVLELLRGAAGDGDGDEDALCDALFELGSVVRTGDAEVVAATLRWANDGTAARWRVRREAVAALGDIAPRGDVASVKCLRRCLRDPDAKLCAIAAYAAARVFSCWDLDGIAALADATGHSSAAVRHRALDAMAALAPASDEMARNAVRARLGDSNVSVMQAAERAVAALTSAAEAGVAQAASALDEVQTDLSAASSWDAEESRSRRRALTEGEEQEEEEEEQIGAGDCAA